MTTIILSSKKYNYQIIKKHIKSIRLKITGRSSFIVSCPFVVPNFLITKFIHQHLDWIVKNSTKLKPHRSLLQLTSLSILGQIFSLNIYLVNHDSVVIFPDKCLINVNTKVKSEIHLQKILEPRLRRLALPLIRQELSNLCRQYNFKYSRLSLKNQKSLFGSCSSQNNLNFNWQIILFPPDKFRHILLHELNHLTIKNHSSKFWQQLALYDPNFRQNNRWLKTSGTKLFLFR